MKIIFFILLMGLCTLSLASNSANNMVQTEQGMGMDPNRPDAPENMPGTNVPVDEINTAPTPAPASNESGDFTGTTLSSEQVRKIHKKDHKKRIPSGQKKKRMDVPARAGEQL